MVEALRAIIGSKSASSLRRGPVDPKFQIEGVAPTNHSSSHKTRLNDLSHDIKKNRFFFRFVTMHAFDGQTDRNLIARPRLHSMQRGKNYTRSCQGRINNAGAPYQRKAGVLFSYA